MRILHVISILSLLTATTLPAQADLRLTETDGGTDFVGFNAPAVVSSSQIWTLPSGDGSANQCMATNGSGILTWVTVGGSSPSFPLLATPKGSATAPAYSFTGTDSDNGMYSPAANELAFSTSGTERVRISGGQLAVAGQIFSSQTVVSSGATVDFNLGNVQVLEAPGASVIAVNNMKDGGSYTIIITDTTSRTYTFSGCTNAHFVPENAATLDGTKSLYTILKVTLAGTTHCFISWLTGF